MKANQIVEKMEIQSNHKGNQIRTDDLAFSAYLKMSGFRLIQSTRNRSKMYFTFDIGEENENALKVAFVNSEFLKFYNELRNLKKLLN